MRVCLGSADGTWTSSPRGFHCLESQARYSVLAGSFPSTSSISKWIRSSLESFSWLNAFSLSSSLRCLFGLLWSTEDGAKPVPSRCLDSTTPFGYPPLACFSTLGEKPNPNPVVLSWRACPPGQIVRHRYPRFSTQYHGRPPSRGGTPSRREEEPREHLAYLHPYLVR